MILKIKAKKEAKEQIKNQQFGGKEDKAKQMYANAPVFVALMYVALPGILISFMQGMFIFADQIMMVNLIPSAKSPSLHDLFGQTSDNIQNFTNAWNYYFRGGNSYKDQISAFSIDSLVRFTVSLITPGLYILNAITILIGMGTAVNFSKAIGARDKERAYDAWSTGVISTICVSVVSSCVIIGIAGLWITGSAGSVQSDTLQKIFNNNSGSFSNSEYAKFLQSSDLNNSMKLVYPAAAQDPKEFPSTTITIHPLKTIKENIDGKLIDITPQMMISDPYKYVYLPFYQQYHAKAIYWSVMYLRIDAGFNIFACFNQYFSLMIRAEGRQFYPAFLATLANAVNIGLDAIFIMVLKMGVFGSVTALVIGWAFNVALFIVYIAVMEKRKNIVTYLKFSRIRFRYFKWEILWIAVGIGVGASIWNAGIALQGSLQNITLAQTTILTDLPYSPSYYVELNGAMLPIVNLTFTALYGTVQGGRALVSYSYGARKYDRVKKEYWMSLGIALIYGAAMYGIIAWGINEYLLDGFKITEGIPDPENAYKFLKNAEYFLRPSILQILTYAFAMPGILLFQSIGKIISASITSALNGFIFSFVSLYMCQAIAVSMAHAGNNFAGMDVFLYALPIDSAMSAVVCFVWSSLYLTFRLGKPTRMQVNKMVRRIRSIDFSLSNDPVDKTKNLPKAFVIITKNKNEFIKQKSQ